MRDAGIVQDPGPLWRQSPEVRVSVNVSESDVGMNAPEAGDDTERDRAVAADYQRALTVLNLAADRVRNLARDLDNRVEVARLRMSVVDSED